jgi:hypothetical protein
MNVFTYLKKKENDFPYQIKIIRNKGINKVRRFHKKKFIDVINKSINFNKYGLLKIKEMCDIHYCKYNHSDDNNVCEIFEMPTIYSRDSNIYKIND